MLNSLGLMEPCVLHGGLALLEHPEDPGEDPYPSIWNTEEWRGFASRCGCTKCSIDQCSLGLHCQEAHWPRHEHRRLRTGPTSLQWQTQTLFRGTGTEGRPGGLQEPSPRYLLPGDVQVDGR